MAQSETIRGWGFVAPALLWTLAFFVVPFGVMAAMSLATLEGREDGQGLLRFNLAGEDFDAALAQAGAMPLPPYIAALRPADAQDKDDYQTVWAARSGAVAAPTASLHFDEPLLAALRG